MELNLNEIQEMVQDSARRFFDAELPPEKVREIEGSTDGFSPDMWTKMAELGWNGLPLPESVGGGGLGMLELCLLAEEAGKAAASTPLLVSTGLAATCLQSVPSSDLAAQLLNRIATTNLVVSSAFIDSGAHNERALSSMVLQDASGSFSLSGSKQLVSYATVAGILLVLASTADGQPAIVAVDTDLDGLSFARHKGSLGGDPLFQVQFDNVTIAQECVLARGDAATAAVEKGMEMATLISLAEAVGLCETILHLTSEYAKVRQQFGQAIGSFQAVAHPIADMRIHLDVIRLLTREAAWLVDQGKPASLEIASTKIFANETVATTAVYGHRLHGAIGYSSEYDLQLFTRRAKAFTVAWGDTDSQIKRGARALGI